MFAVDYVNAVHKNCSIVDKKLYRLLDLCRVLVREWLRRSTFLQLGSHSQDHRGRRFVVSYSRIECEHFVLLYICIIFNCPRFFMHHCSRTVICVRWQTLSVWNWSIEPLTNTAMKFVKGRRTSCEHVLFSQRKQPRFPRKRVKNVNNVFGPYTSFA